MSESETIYINETNTTELLRSARVAVRDYDPEDGEPSDSPAWRLLMAFERLDALLTAGASLPAEWSAATLDAAEREAGQR